MPVRTEAVKDRSYQVRRQIKPGEFATITAEVRRYGVTALMPGEQVRVLTYSNAGFNGIEASVQRKDGRVVHGVSAGLLT